MKGGDAKVTRYLVTLLLVLVLSVLIGEVGGTVHPANAMMNSMFPGPGTPASSGPAVCLADSSAQIARITADGGTVVDPVLLTAYNAIVSNPKFADLLAQVPLKHPAQLYESFCYIFVFAILMYLYWKTETTQKHGLLFGVFLILLWSVRFVVEYVKGSQGGIENSLGLFSTGQWLSIPFILVGLYFLFMAERPLPENLKY